MIIKVRELISQIYDKKAHTHDNCYVIFLLLRETIVGEMSYCEVDEGLFVI